MKKLFLVLTSLLCICSYAQTEVNSFSPGANEGVTYCLPDTRIDITVEATSITYTPGEFNRYADRYLRMNNTISEAAVQWTLDNIEVREVGVASTEKMYTIRLNNNSSASNIVLDNNGIIAAINRQPEPVATSTATTRAATKKPDATLYMTEEMLQANSTAKLAELTAKEIYSIRESKLAITRATAENMPRDGQAIELLLKELDKQEKALTELFTGYSDTVTHIFKFTIMPDAEHNDISKEVLFRFSRKMGVLDSNNLAGEPVYYDFKDLKSVQMPTKEEQERMQNLKHEGICYNVPGKASIGIYTRSRRFVETELCIAQFGTTEILDKKLFSKSRNTRVLFNTATGGIISIEREN